jgi:hypothetical protein
VIASLLLQFTPSHQKAECQYRLFLFAVPRSVAANIDRICTQHRKDIDYSAPAQDEMEFDVRGSVHHSIIHIENPTRCTSVSKFYFIFECSSICFRRHTAHCQELKTALVTSGLAYVEGCWTCSCWTLTASSNYTSAISSTVAASSSIVWQYLKLYVQLWSPDDGRRNRLKHVERL